MRTIIFKVESEPVAFARARGGTMTNHRFTPPKQRGYMKLIRDNAALAMNGEALFDSALILQARFVYKPPASWSKRQKEFAIGRPKTSKPDLDNLTKIIKDALNGVVYRDDAQVASLTVQKTYGDRDEIIVTLSEIDSATVLPSVRGAGAGGGCGKFAPPSVGAA